MLERFAYPRLYNLYLDPKEQHNYLTRKLAYIEAFQLGMRTHLGTFKQLPAEEGHGASRWRTSASSAGWRGHAGKLPARVPGQVPHGFSRPEGRSMPCFHGFLALFVDA